MSVRVVTKILFLSAVLASSLAYADGHKGKAEWQEIAAPASAVVDGREIHPSCALGQPYSFFYKPGAKKNVLVFLNGGGACWNFATCVASLNTPLSAYVPDINPNNSPVDQNGVFDLNNPDNPFRDWSMVFVPYCTGDIHWGSQDTTYTGADPAGNAVSATIHHRGFDNFMFVRDWMKDKFTETEHKGKVESKVKKLVVAGSSAGAYGVALAFPYLKDIMPEASSVLVSDGGAGVITDGFLDQALQGADATWGVAKNLPTQVPGIDVLLTDAVNAEAYLPTFYSALTQYYPKDRFAQYTTAWDAVQVMFTNIMLHDTDIAQWPNLQPQLFGYWTTVMRTSSHLLASAPNYRFYIAPGCNHTALRFNDAFYADSGVGGVTFLQWLESSTKKHANDWLNLECTDCAPPSAQEVGACLQRSFGP